MKSTGRSRLPLSLWLIPLCILAGFAYFFFATPSASAAIFVLPTPTQENLWAYVNLPKPTYTASPVPSAMPLPTDTAIPTPVATETPAQLAMEMVSGAAAQNSTNQEQLAPPAPSYGGSKYILVDISEQHMYVYDGDQLVYSFVASTGIENSTRIGNFAVQSKIPNAYGSTWNIWMPNWLGIYWSHGLENGIHALPILSNGATLWAGFLGRPVSFGCVVLGTYESKLLYDWAEIGTPVDIQW
jgi:lipoprotein-anchoring transpeptidase ErfK/SrfK